jgi:DNA-binding transcriptional MocR family regulator
VFKWAKIQIEDIQQGAKILGTKTCVFYLLKMYAGKTDEMLAYPSQSTLAEISGLSVSSIAKALKQLKDAGWIALEGYTDTPMRTAIWRICEPGERVCKIRHEGYVKSGKTPMPNLTNKKESIKKEINIKSIPDDFPNIKVRYSPKL